jgi:hypothetical protein
MQPCRLVFLEVDQKLRQPLAVGSERQPADQRGAVGVGRSETRRPPLGFGSDPTASTWVSHVVWPTNEDEPPIAEERFVADVRAWLASEEGLL